jgi:hypothetical protein
MPATTAKPATTSVEIWIAEAVAKITLGSLPHRARRLEEPQAQRNPSAAETVPLRWRPMNTLYYGDNLDVLQKHVATESVDLIYLDPPFKSNRSYNVLFKSHSGDELAAQIEAFDDSWHWSQQAEAQYAA